MKINPVPASISDEELQVNICKALSLTGHEVKPDNLKLAMVKFKLRKLRRNVLVNRKNPRNKSTLLGSGIMQ